MQALIEFIIALAAMVVAASLAQFGIDLNAPAAQDREIRRVIDCPEPVHSSPARTGQSC